MRGLTADEAEVLRLACMSTVCVLARRYLPAAYSLVDRTLVVATPASPTETRFVGTDLGRLALSVHEAVEVAGRCWTSSG